jgi:hypothetical protein
VERRPCPELAEWAPSAAGFDFGFANSQKPIAKSSCFNQIPNTACLQAHFGLHQILLG